MRSILAIIACMGVTLLSFAQDLTQGLAINDLSAKPMQNVAKPAYLEAITDPAFGTTIRRITNAGNGGVIVPMYNTIQPWNADESLMIVYNQSIGTHQLLDGKTYSFIRNLNDIRPADIEQIYWDFDNPAILYYLDGYTYDFIRYTVENQQKEILVNLNTITSNCSGFFSMGNDVQMISWDSDVFGFRCNNERAYYYRISTGAITEFAINSIRYTAPMPAPSGNLFYHDRQIYNANGTLQTTLNERNVEHSCLGKLANGNDAYFAIAFAEGPDGGCIGDIIAHDLTTGNCFPLISESQGYDYPQSGTHISALAHKNTEGGWVAASMMGYDRDGQSLLDQELVIVKAEQGNVKVCRIGHHRSDDDQFGYWGEPHACISPSGTRILLGSDWSGSEDGQSVDCYVVELPAYQNTDNTNPAASCDCEPLPAPTNTTITVSTAAELQVAMQQANTNNGDMTILLEDGTYELTTNLFYIGTNISNLTLRSVSGNRDAVIIRGQGMTGNVSHIFNVAASNFTVADMTIGWVANHPIQIHGEQNADNCLIQNVRFVDGNEQLLKVSGFEAVENSDNGVVQCCLFEFSAGVANQSYTGGIDAHKAQNWIIRNNTFKHIRSPDAGLAEHAIHFWSDAGGTIVENNLIINCDRGIGFGLGNSRHTGGIIRNNMVHTSRDVGIGLESASDAKVYNNTVITDNYPRPIEYRFAETRNAHIANNLTSGSISARDGGTGTIENNFTTTDKSIFVDADNYDFHLTTIQSQITNAGKILPEISVDYDCDDRLDAPDIGADEYGAGGGQDECLLERIHTNEILTEGLYPTIGNIYSRAIIESAVTYKAGNTITLQAGFYAKAGSDFSAIIETCNLSRTITENLPAEEYLSIATKKVTNSQQNLVVVPNPIESEATIYYELVTASMLTLDLYDVTGKKVMNMLPNTLLSAGKYQKSVNVSHLNKGLYIVVMNTQGKVVTQKIIIQ